ERLAPAGLGRARRADLLSRLVADVDALQDYFLRWLLPVGTAGVVCVASIVFALVWSPVAAGMLALGLALAGIGVPALTAGLSRRTERLLAPAQAALATRTLDVLTGTAELTVAGALGGRRAAARDADTR
ncbi:hypothetical protein AN216_00220, partial [Streptomyces oceani]